MRRTWRVLRGVVGVSARRGGTVLINSYCSGKSCYRSGHAVEEESRMRVACYARVSTDRQQQAQTIEQQVSLLRAYVGSHPDWVLREEHIFRDDGYTGARLQRPGLDALRDHVARAELDVVVITAPDRLARH